MRTSKLSRKPERREKIDTTLPCEVCWFPVKYTRKRFLEVVEKKLTVLCGQCRRYVLPGSVRVAQLSTEDHPPSLSLHHKTRKGSREQTSIEHYPLHRCGRSEET